MDQFVIYDQLQKSLPQGTFYKLDGVPYKIDPYIFLIDTLYPYKTIFIDFGGNTYTLVTDGSGVLQISLRLNLGANKLRWRFSGAIGWYTVLVTTTNLGTVHGGLADSFGALFNNASQIWENALIGQASDTSNFSFLSGISTDVSADRLEEALQAMQFFTDTDRGIIQVSGAIDSIPATMRPIGTFNTAKNLVCDPLFDNAILNYYSDQGTLIVVNNFSNLFNNVLQYTGTGTIQIYVKLSDIINEFGDWECDFYARSILGNAIPIGMDFSTDGQNWISGPAISIGTGAIPTAWIKYSNVLPSTFNPKFCRITCSLGPTLFRVLQVGPLSVRRTNWARTFPMSIGRYNGSASRAVIEHSPVLKMDIVNTMDFMLPIGIDPVYVADSSAAGFWDATLTSPGTLLNNLNFDATKNCLVLDSDVVRHLDNVPWLDANTARLPTHGTMLDGLLIKNGSVLSNDAWSWVNNQTIMLTTGVVAYADVFSFTYEQLTNYVSPIIDLISVDINYDYIVDGYIYSKIKRVPTGNYIVYRELVIFDQDNKANLSFQSLDQTFGELRDSNQKLIINWNYVDASTITYGNNIGSYWFSYKIATNEYVNSGTVIYHKSADDLYTLGNTAWSQAQFGDMIAAQRYHQIQAQFLAPMTQDEIRLRSVVIKKIKLY